MSAAVNNGVQIGPVTVLVRETERKRTPFEMLKDVAIGLFFWQYQETVGWRVSVHSNETREVLASRQFDSKHRAERARADLVAVAQTCDDLTGYDWGIALTRT